MTRPPLAAVVMAAGLGTRMKSRLPKHLHPLLGRRVVDWVLDAAAPLAASPFVVVVSAESKAEIEGSLPDAVSLAVQEEPRGTGDAVAAARGALAGFDGDILVLPGDTPLLTTQLLEDLVEWHRRESAAVTVVSAELAEPRPYGRILRDEEGRLRAIVEAADASPEELAIRELNASIYVFAASDLWPALERLDSDNAQRELYLTDTIRHLVGAGRPAAVFRARDPVETEGVNTRAELAVAAAVLRDRVNEAHMLAGVTLVDPITTWIEAGVEIEADATILPFTVLRGSTRIAAGAEVGPHAVALDAVIGPDVSVGPFCYLRPGTILEAGAKAGTFVEIKNSRVGARAKVPHMSYVGDAEIGDGTNIGAGAITANFPHEAGSPKGRTTIGRNVRTGVHNSFIAPVTIGDDAWTAAGSVITEDVPPEALAIARARQVNKEGYAGGKRSD